MDNIAHLIHPSIPGKPAIISGATPMRACNPREPYVQCPVAPGVTMCETCQDVVAWHEPTGVPA